MSVSLMWKGKGLSENMSKLIVLDRKRLLVFRKLGVVGDLHGDLESLESALRCFDLAKDGVIFLGDYSDRGAFGIEVVDRVDYIMRRYSQNVFALKGNHEDYQGGHPSFDWENYPSLVNQVEKNRGGWHEYFEGTFKPFVGCLALALVVPGEALFVHGGVSSKIKSLKDLSEPTREIELDTLWSDPFEGQGEYPNERGIGVEFGEDITRRVCRLLGVKKIVRSHEPHKVMMAGAPCYSHDGRVITISTTTSYGEGYEPFILSINPVDFSLESYQIAADPPVQANIVSCKSCGL
jgi:hypothetical protein